MPSLPAFPWWRLCRLIGHVRESYSYPGVRLHRRGYYFPCTRWGDRCRRCGADGDELWTQGLLRQWAEPIIHFCRDSWREWVNRPTREPTDDDCPF